MSHDSKTNGTERLRATDAAAAGREELEVIELFRVARTNLDHHLPAKAAAQEQSADVQEETAEAAPRRMQMLETADAPVQRHGVVLPEEARWMQMDQVLRDQFLARQKRAVRRRSLQPYVAAVLIAAALAALAFSSVMAWQHGGEVLEFIRRLFQPAPASSAMGALADPAALAQAVADSLRFG